MRGRRAEKVEADMSAILLAVFDDYSVAERVRVSLVRDGFSNRSSRADGLLRARPTASTAVSSRARPTERIQPPRAKY
jgi:hypothetical protein